jgi:hypothetical protein
MPAVDRVVQIIGVLKIREFDAYFQSPFCLPPWS